ncbi:Hypothetical protein PBC10988_32790 [Planctomycetales bacterium 10988]|nr:Hypothetical protein PBC10988_32790 [Planctomycetales bacterium 10988]
MNDETFSDAGKMPPKSSRPSTPGPSSTPPFSSQDDYGATFADGGPMSAPGSMPSRSPAGSFGQPAPSSGMGGGAEDEYGATFADGSAAESGGSSGFLSPGTGQNVQPYQVVHLIGRGGMGLVQLAQDTRLGRYVALKRLSPEFASNQRLLSRFDIEAKAVSKLSHYHIVQVYAMDYDQEGPYIAMEYVAGPRGFSRPDWPSQLPAPPVDLDDWVKHQGPFSVQKALELGKKICRAVGFAHRQGIIHRDIKPANILLTEDAEPKLADFGLAREVSDQQDGHTLAGAQMLTLGYGAPEQEIDASKVDERADIYAIGATLWFVLTGQNPRYFRENEVDPQIRPVIVKALEKDREQRYATAGEMEEALQALEVASAGVLQGGMPILPGQQMVSGKCRSCGHQHVLNADGTLNRNFCDGCGENLRVDCLSCGQPEWTWSKFCGSCGCELAKTEEQMANQMKEVLDQANQLADDGRWKDAYNAVEKVATASYPGWPALEARVKECTELRTQWQQQAKAAQEQREKATAAAKEAFHEKRFSEVVQLLEEIPLGLRDEAITQQLTEATKIRDQLQDLNQQIEQKLQQKAYDGMLGLIDRILAIQPENEHAKKLHFQFERLEARSLSQEIQERFAQHQYSGLKAKVQELLKLTPKDPQAKKMLEQLSRWELQHEEPRLWQELTQKPVFEGFRNYLERFPTGPHREEAQQQVVYELRNQLLSDPQGKEKRLEYLKYRTPELLEKDEDLVRNHLAKQGAFWGGLIGLIGCVIGSIPGAIFGYIYGKNNLLTPKDYRWQAFLGPVPMRLAASNPTSIARLQQRLLGDTPLGQVIPEEMQTFPEKKPTGSTLPWVAFGAAAVVIPLILGGLVLFSGELVIPEAPVPTAWDAYQECDYEEALVRADLAIELGEPAAEEYSDRAYLKLVSALSQYATGELGSVQPGSASLAKAREKVASSIVEDAKAALKLNPDDSVARVLQYTATDGESPLGYGFLFYKKSPKEMEQQFVDAGTWEQDRAAYHVLYTLWLLETKIESNQTFPGMGTMNAPSAKQILLFTNQLDLAEALSWDDPHVTLMKARMQSYRNLAEMEEAFSESIRLAPESNVLGYLLRAAHGTDPFLAADDLSRAIDIRPEGYFLYQLRAGAYQQLGMFMEARADAQVAQEFQQVAGEKQLR